MKSELEKLWYSYQIELSAKYDNKEKATIKNLTELEHKLHSLLNEEQMNVFKEYDNKLCQINSISEKKAFITGITFATRFLFDALHED